MAEERPSITRVRSCRKVSCETLTDSDWESNIRSCEPRSFHYTDSSPYPVQFEGEELGCNGEEVCSHGKNIKVDTHSNHGNTGSFLAASHRLFARFLHKMQYMPSARSSKRSGKRLRSFPSSLHLSGAVLPHSGPLNLVQKGNHSGSLNSVNNKAPTTVKNPSIIPPGCKLAAAGFTSAADPSSPKVTLLGRVRIKHRYPKEAQKDSKGQDDLHCSCNVMVIMKRRQKSAIQKKSFRSSEYERDTHQKDMTSSTETIQKLMKQDRNGNSGSRGTKKDRRRWNQQHATADEEHKQDVHSSQAVEASAMLVQVQAQPNLRRFSSGENTSTASDLLIGESQHMVEGDGKLQIAQIPPQNVLLLTRNRKRKDSFQVSSSARGEDGPSTTLSGVTMQSECDDGRSKTEFSLNAVKVARVFESPALKREDSMAPEHSPHEKCLWKRRAGGELSPLDVPPTSHIAVR